MVPELVILRPRRLEAELERLELHTDAMRATDAGNAERLAYNRRILTERSQENAAALTRDARRLTRQRDALAELKVDAVLKSDRAIYVHCGGAQSWAKDSSGLIGG